MASKRRVAVLRSIAATLLLSALVRAESDRAVVAALPALPAAKIVAAAAQLVIAVHDENGKAVPAARVAIIVPGTNITLQRETDFGGNLRLPLVPGTYYVEVEKDGFYAAQVPDLLVGTKSLVEITLRHVQEFHETIEVTDSARGIELAQTTSEQKLTNREIFSLPYPTTRDYRNVLVFIPGIVQDNNGQIHVAGAASYQLMQQLDGFNIT